MTPSTFVFEASCCDTVDACAASSCVSPSISLHFVPFRRLYSWTENLAQSRCSVPRKATGPVIGAMIAIVGLAHDAALAALEAYGALVAPADVAAAAASAAARANTTSLFMWYVLLLFPRVPGRCRRPPRTGGSDPSPGRAGSSRRTA